MLAFIASLLRRGAEVKPENARFAGGTDVVVSLIAIEIT